MSENYLLTGRKMWTIEYHVSKPPNDAPPQEGSFLCEKSE